MTTARPTATNGTDKPSGPRSRKGIETRARLVDAAKEVFERDGFLDARISDIAEKAGLSHGSFYHYFESKEEVFREVAAEVEVEVRCGRGAPGRSPEPMLRVVVMPHTPSRRGRAGLIGPTPDASPKSSPPRGVSGGPRDGWAVRRVR